MDIGRGARRMRFDRSAPAGAPRSEAGTGLTHPYADPAGAAGPKRARGFRATKDQRGHELDADWADDVA
jgi:hypothetical protein